RYSEESGARAMSDILARKRERPTAVFGANDMLAIGAMVFARNAGLSVPGDIAIAGFDDIPSAKLLGLTTVRQPEFDLGALADRGFPARITSQQIGNAWLNYIVEDRSILWWGGLGNSTEHTAYLRLKSGIPAPQSGSIELNGKTVAEQIGAQIFIDGWAMVS